MKKLLRRARQAVHPPTSSDRSSPADPVSKQEEQPVSSANPPVQNEPAKPTFSQQQVSGAKSAHVCLRLSAMVELITLRWETDHQLDLTPDLEELWSTFCDAGRHANSQQQLVGFVKSLAEGTITENDIARESSIARWKDLPSFKHTVEQRLQQSFMAGPEAMAAWINLNHLLARISLPPASIYDLRMVCLWNLRDVLETRSANVTVDMLKILMLWLGGHIHWLQLQILRAHSKRYPADTLMSLKIGDISLNMSTTLQPVVDLERLTFWRRRLRGLHGSEAADATMKFYANGVLSLLEVGIAEVDEWKQEVPPTRLDLSEKD